MNCHKTVLYGFESGIGGVRVRVGGGCRVEVELYRLRTVTKEKKKRQRCDREYDLLVLCIILLSKLVPISQAGAGRPSGERVLARPRHS